MTVAQEDGRAQGWDIGRPLNAAAVGGMKLVEWGCKVTSPTPAKHEYRGLPGVDFGGSRLHIGFDTSQPTEEYQCPFVRQGSLTEACCGECSCGPVNVNCRTLTSEIRL